MILFVSHLETCEFFIALTTFGLRILVGVMMSLSLTSSLKRFLLLSPLHYHCWNKLICYNSYFKNFLIWPLITNGSSNWFVHLIPLTIWPVWESHVFGKIIFSGLWIQNTISTNLVPICKTHPAIAWLANLAKWELSQLVIMHISLNSCKEVRILFFPLQKIVEKGLNCWTLWLSHFPVAS